MNTGVKVGLATGGFVAALFAIAFAIGSFEPVDLLVAGQRGPSIEVITEDFGPVDNPRPGYDGQQVYALARDFPDLDAAADHLDSPAYRSTRILQSALASPAPDGTALVLALLGLGIVGVALGAGALADLAERHGRDARLGFVAVPGLALPLLLTTNEALAFGAAFAAIAFLDRRRVWVAAAFGVVAVLTKESAIVALGAAAVGTFPAQRWRVAPAVVVPVVTLGAWRLIVDQLVPGGSPDRFQLLAMFEMSATALAYVLVVIALGLVGAWCWRDVAALWPVSLAFGLWPLVFRTDSLDWLALTRVVAPAVVLGTTGIVGVWWRQPRHEPVAR